MPIDYTIYPNNWKEIRERILHRADHKCEFCGLLNYSSVLSVLYLNNRIWLNNLNDMQTILNTQSMDTEIYNTKVVKVVLTIAHLDHDPRNHNVTDDRLRALCQLCHLKYDKKCKILAKTKL